MSFFTHDQAVFSINKIYPEARHGKDFWIAHPVSEGSGEQLGDAFIAGWSLEAAQPTAEELADLVSQYQEDWNAFLNPELTFEELIFNKVEAIKVQGDTVMQGGFPFDAGAHGIQHLQTRNDTDRTNWLTSQAAYKAQIDFGNGDVAGAHFRTAENITMTLTYSEGYMLLLQLAAWGAHVYGVAWAKQDAARAATTIEELDAISITDGWDAAV